MNRVRFVGLDVHAETIAVAVAEAEGEVRSVGVIPNRPELIRKLVKKLGPAEQLRACYEAGPTGYVVYWQVTALGVKCEVVAPGNPQRADGGVGGGWLSLVGAAEGAVAPVNAVDSQTLSSAVGSRGAVAEDQCATDRPAAESGKVAEATATLRTHQAGLSSQAPDSGADRPLGCAESRLHGSGLGLAFWQFRHRRVCAHPQRHRPAYDLDGITSSAGARRRGRAAGSERDRRGLALPLAGSRPGQRICGTWWVSV